MAFKFNPFTSNLDLVSDAEMNLWNRTVTVLSPANVGDSLDMGAGNIVIAGTVDGIDVSAIPTTYLKLDQTTPQTPVGTFTLPIVHTPTINGGILANDDITIQGTTSATRTTSYVILQPNGGNVGIGTTAPTSNLYVRGSVSNTVTIEETSPSGGAMLKLYDSGGTPGSTTLYRFGSTHTLASKFGISTDGGTTQNLVIDTSGNVGIGTTGPTNILSLGGNTARTFWLERHTTTDTAGVNFSILGGGCTAGATNKNSGILIIGGQLATGLGQTEVQIVGSNGVNNGATVDITPATMIDVINNKIGFYGVAPVVRPTALTTQLTTVTCSAPGTPDYAIADLTQTLPYGFVSADEGQSVLKVIANLQTRVAELETKLQALGILT